MSLEYSERSLRELRSDRESVLRVLPGEHLHQQSLDPAPERGT